MYWKLKSMDNRLSNRVSVELFTKKFTPESVYVLGLLWSDGFLNKTKNHYSINLQCVRGDVDEFYKIFQKTGDWIFYERPQRGKNKPTGIVSTSNKELHNFLSKNDYLNKTKESPVKILKKIPKKLHRYFYLGWSDGDGCFYFNKKNYLNQFIIASAWEQDWSSMIELCDKLGLEYRIQVVKRKKGNYSQFQINKMKHIATLGLYFYREIENNKIGLTRKNIKFMEMLNFYNSKNHG
jgi:intein-encoded DNA endonuclease-like protein